MKNLYYVRHGESTINANRVWGARAAAPLTRAGRSQARNAGLQIKKFGLLPDVIVASPTERAKETALIICNEIGYNPKDVIFSEHFLERAVGVLEGTTFDDFFRDNKYEDLDKVAGAETIKQLQDRAKVAHAYLLEIPYRNVLVVGHSAFGRALKRVIENLPHHEEYNSHDSLPHAEVLKLI